MQPTLDEAYWNNRYLNKETGWDLRQVSPPLKAYIHQIEDKNIAILIPGCGNAYEAHYLAEQGFTNITVIDIAESLVQDLQVQFKNYFAIRVLHQDFFMHDGQYDLILEQTFFCAIDPSLREEYVQKMNTLLKPNGKLVGVLFNRNFETDGPPFGGTEEEYNTLFSKDFHLHTLASCHNSFSKRAGTELFMNCRIKKTSLKFKQ